MTKHVLRNVFPELCAFYIFQAISELDENSIFWSFPTASCSMKAKVGTDPAATTQESLYIQGPRRTAIFLKGERWNNSSHKAFCTARGQRQLCLRFCLFACLLATQQHEALGGFPSPALIHLAMKANTPVTWHLLLHIPQQEKQHYWTQTGLHLLSYTISIYRKTNTSFYRRRMPSTFYVHIFAEGLLGLCKWLWQSATLNSCFITCIT